LGAAAKAATGISKAAFKAGTRETMTGLKGLGEGGLKGFAKKAWCKVGFGTCFTAGTLIHTPDGDRQLETLRAGDKVYCFDQTTGAQTLETIEETFVRTTTRLFHLTVGSDFISTTAEHPFMVHGMGWIQAADLRPGDRLVTATDPNVTVGEATVTLDALRAETLDDADAVTVYNIHVHTHHTYYVLAGDIPILVHNMAGHTGPPRFVTTKSGDIIDRSSIRTTISSQKQARHIAGPNYRHGGYFNDASDAQKVLDEFHDGTASVLGVHGSGNNSFVVVRSPTVRGINHNPRSGFLHQPTDIFFIKGSAKPSVVPATPGWTS
jgi:hypothetical protein